MFKSLKFKKSKYPIFKFAFWTFIICTFFIFLKIMIINLYGFEAKPFNYPLKPIAINLTLKKPINDRIFFCFNDYCKMPTNNSILGFNSELSNIYSVKLNDEDEYFRKNKIKKIYLAYPKKTNHIKNNIQNVDIQIGPKTNHYNIKQINELKNKETKIQIDENKELVEYKVVAFENINNYKGILNHAINLLLSLFSSWNFFIIPYCWSIFICLVYVFKKDEIGFMPKITNKTHYIIFSLIILLATIFRFNEINLYPLWLDEIYTKTIAIKSFATTFQDAGNPPAFYIVAFLFSKFSNSDFILRLPSIIFGILTIPMTYLLFENINKKTALFASFMATINTIFINTSQEARAYSMSCFLGILVIYLLFKYLEKTTIKNLIYFTLASIIAINTHYILAIFIFGNFFWGIFDLIQNNKKKETINFTISNVLIGLSFIPYLIINYKNALGIGFNSWIPAFNSKLFTQIIEQYFVNNKIFILFAIITLLMYLISFIPQKIKEKININNKKENLLNYACYSLAFVLTIGAIISYYIKPFIHIRALLAVYFLLFILEILIISTIFNFEKIKNKYLISLKILYGFAMILIVFNITIPVNYKETVSLNNYLDFINYDSTKYTKDYQIHALLPESEEYLEYFPEIKNKNITWHFIPLNKGIHVSAIDKKDFVKNKEKTVIYFNDTTTDFSMTFFKNPKMKFYDTNSGKNGKIIFE